MSVLHNVVHGAQDGTGTRWGSETGINLLAAWAILCGHRVRIKRIGDNTGHTPGLDHAGS